MHLSKQELEFYLLRSGQPMFSLRKRNVTLNMEVLDTLGLVHCPAVVDHMRQLHFAYRVVLAQAWLDLFVNFFDAEEVTRVWDLFFFYSSFKEKHKT